MKADGEVDEESKTSESGRLAEAGTYASVSKQTIQALESELASLSPAELAAPAYYDPDSKRPSHLTDPSAPGDLFRPLGDRQFDEIHAGFLYHLVLFFHDQASLRPEEQMRFGRRFGFPALRTGLGPKLTGPAAAPP